jgi:hypothetical protein
MSYSLIFQGASVTPNEALIIIELLSALTALHGSTALPNQQAPASIDIQRSVADTADSIIRCYHPSGRLKTVDVVEAPWSRQNDWNAMSSAVLRIHWRGTIKDYVSTVGLVEHDGQVHAVLLEDGAIIPANHHCALDGWVSARK